MQIIKNILRKKIMSGKYYPYDQGIQSLQELKDTRITNFVSTTNLYTKSGRSYYYRFIDKNGEVIY